MVQPVKSNAVALSRLQAALEHACSPLALSHARFDEAHELFERSSSQQQLILDWLIELISSQYALHPELRILSVGCGSGILDVPLIRSIASTTRQLKYTGVDPNERACQRFQDDFDNQHFSNTQLDLRVQDIESLTSTDLFDVICLVHSMYYFDDPASTLDKLLELLAPGGRLVIVQAPDAELNQLAKCFWTHHEENGIWFSDCLAGHLAERRLAFTRERIEGQVDVSRCFRADCPRGEMMLDFITQSESRQLDGDIVQLCLRYLDCVSRPQEDSLLVAHPADAFVIA